MTDSNPSAAVTYLSGRDARYQVICEDLPFRSLTGRVRLVLSEWMQRTEFGHVIDHDLLTVLGSWRMLGRNSVLLSGEGDVLACALDRSLTERLPGLLDLVVGAARQVIEPESPRAIQLRQIGASRPVAQFAVLPLQLGDVTAIAVVVEVA